MVGRAPVPRTPTFPTGPVRIGTRFRWGGTATWVRTRLTQQMTRRDLRERAIPPPQDVLAVRRTASRLPRQASEEPIGHAVRKIGRRRRPWI